MRLKTFALTMLPPVQCWVKIFCPTFIYGIFEETTLTG